MSIDPFSPLIWWVEYEKQFSSLSFFACQVMGIMGSQIETKKIFSMLRVIVGLQPCHLGIENLDKLVPSMKNKLDDPNQLGCSNCYKFIDENFTNADGWS